MSLSSVQTPWGSGPHTAAGQLTRLTEQQQFRNETEFNFRANTFQEAQQRLSLQNSLQQATPTQTPASPPETLPLRMRDHGPGLAPTALERLFQPFAKSAQVAAETASGVGLGLALSHRLSRELGGDLRLDRQVKDGAAFLLLLPLNLR